MAMIENVFLAVSHLIYWEGMLALAIKKGWNKSNILRRFYLLIRD